ncbi:actin [Brachionus plicatilis]|uniref:Actin n=1 Tax=Brachionus plicatilis TaxID=10195 RepID=A0A3M7TCW3_BRAPC|nr:actin [Brachionus plicatilis]
MKALVLDCGSDSIKAGLSGDSEPSLLLSTNMALNKSHESKIGNIGQERRDILRLNCPINRGFITNWNDMEKIWSFVFDEIKVDPDNQPIFLSESPCCSRSQRERITELMFEKFTVPSMSMQLQSVLSMLSTGLESGIIVECGDGLTQILPMFKNLAVSNAFARIELGGTDLSDYLFNLMNAKESVIPNRNVSKEIKEKFCYVSTDIKNESKAPSEKLSACLDYNLPDGKTLSISKERFLVPEALFDPSSIGFLLPGIHQVCLKATKKCETNIQKSLFENIVVTGGTTLLPGFTERFQKEMKKIAPWRTSVKVTLHPKPKYSAWLGGSILTSLPNFENILIHKKDYDEFGSWVIQKKTNFFASFVGN